jgi:pyruvate formate lyase activating enzyme
MEIYGLQKLTALDFPGYAACTVFTGGCDFRCPFCHNYALACNTEQKTITETKFFEFLKTRIEKLDGVAVTGGEPCLNKDLPEFLRKIKSLNFMTKLDTNGYHPQMLKHIIAENLVDYIAMDIKNSPDKYAETAGVKRIDIERINESIHLIMASNIDYEFRTTIVDELHNTADIKAISKWITGAKQYFLQAFVDRESVPNHNFHTPSVTKLNACLDSVSPRNIKNAFIRGI